MSDNNSSFAAFSNQMADAVEKAAASTVLVNARARHPASGVAVSADTILTASHVVEREEEITVLLPDGREISANLAGRDNASDLALLRLAQAAATPAEQAGQEASVGQLVFALGRPNSGGIQASLGIVSALGGPMRTGRASLLERYLRTDTIPYPGFSGGPLVDASGRVLGMNTSGFTPGALITIPAALAWPVAETLRAQGRIPRGYLGVRTQIIPLPASMQQKLGRTQERALLLVGVESGSSAERSGLIVGDILAGLDGNPLRDHDELAARLLRDSVGRSLPVEILRGGELIRLNVEVGEG